MPAIEQPTNPTAQREPVHGEVAATEEQQQAAPIGPEQRGRPAKPRVELPPPGEATVPTNDGQIASVVPFRENPWPTSRTTLPASVEQQVGLAMLGLGALTTVGRRFALAMTGFPQQNVNVESMRQAMPQPMPTVSQVPVEEARPEPEDETEMAATEAEA